MKKQLTNERSKQDIRSQLYDLIYYETLDRTQPSLTADQTAKLIKRP